MDWLLDEVATGLQKLMTLSLESTPAADMIAATGMTWVEAISAGRAFDRQLDAPRIRAAFRILEGRCTRWPAPRELLEAMPARRQRPALTDDVRATPELVEAEMAKMRALLGVPTLDRDDVEADS